MESPKNCTSVYIRERHGKGSSESRFGEAHVTVSGSRLMEPPCKIQSDRFSKTAFRARFDLLNHSDGLILVQVFVSCATIPARAAGRVSPDCLIRKSVRGHLAAVLAVLTPSIGIGD